MQPVVLSTPVGVIRQIKIHGRYHIPVQVECSLINQPIEFFIVLYLFFVRVFQNPANNQIRSIIILVQVAYPFVFQIFIIEILSRPHVFPCFVVHKSLCYQYLVFVLVTQRKQFPCNQGNTILCQATVFIVQLLNRIGIDIRDVVIQTIFQSVISPRGCHYGQFIIRMIAYHNRIKGLFIINHVHHILAPMSIFPGDLFHPKLVFRRVIHIQIIVRVATCK